MNEATTSLTRAETAFRPSTEAIDFYNRNAY